MISAEEVRALVDYDPETGVFIWRQRPVTHSRMKIWNAVNAGKVAGHVFVRGDRKLKLGDRFYVASRIAWLLIYGEMPPKWIDHINGNADDNRITNLRLATPTENARNRKMHRGTASGHKGVRCHSGGKYQASITVDYQRIHLGTFSRRSDAAAAYAAAALKYHGAFARTE